MKNNYRWEETVPKQNFVKVTTPKELESLQTFGVGRVRELIRVKDNIIYDKKAEICALREKNDRLLEVIKMMVRGISNMSSPSYGPFKVV